MTDLVHRTKSGSVEEENQEINWKQRYEKQKKEKNKLVQEYKQKLKKSKFEMEKVSNYYRKQIEIFKNKQTELLKHISSTHYSSTKQSIKYVFIEDIKQIKLNEGARNNASIEITFKNGEESIFNNIDIIDTNNSSSNNNNNNISSSSTHENVSQNNEVEAILYDELEKRIQDLDNLINITFGEKYMINDDEDYENEVNDNKNDDISLSMRLRLIEYVNEIKMRHNQYNLVHRIAQNSTSLDDIKHAIKKQGNEGMQRQLSVNKMNLQRLHKNNAFWRNLLLNFPVDIVGILCFELNDRIHDVQNVKDVLYKNEEFALYETMDDIMADIKSRHKDSFRSWTKTDNTHKLSEKWDNIIGEVNINNTRWIKQIHFDALPVVQNTPKEAQTNNNNNNNNSYESIASSCNNWLLKDENRNEFLDSLQVNHHTVKLLKYIGAYLNRMIPVKDSDDMEHTSLMEDEYNKLQSLYIPIVTTDPYNVLAACLDGVLFAILLNKLENNCIDLRVLQLPSKDSKTLQPLSENEISENIMIIFSTLKGLNIQLPQWNIDDYFDANNTVNIILCIVFQIFHAMLDREINLHMHPELLRLCQNDVEIQNAPYLSWKKWLNKWLLHLKNPQKIPLKSIKTHKRDSLVMKKAPISLLSEEKENKKKKKENKKKGDNKASDDNNNKQNGGNKESQIAQEELIRNILHTIDYHDYLILICCRMDSEFLTEKLPQIQSHRNNVNNENNFVDDIFTSKLLLECIVNIIGTKTMVRIEDLASRNPLLQQLLICDIFGGNNKIHALSNSEKKAFTHIVHLPTKEENMFMAWINAYFGDHKWHIKNLKYALNDGVIILKLLDKLKAGCVDWKSVRLQDEIRHKFDRLTNCTLIMDVCSDHFLFNLIGMNGSDIADGNLKYVNILLWHIMCYGSTRLLSEIKFNGKQVTEKMILQWTNNRIKQYKKKCAANEKKKKKMILKLVGIKSLHDHTLNDSILFLNLLSSICDDWVNYEFVHDVDNHHQYKKERLSNARYCITIIRKLDAKLFMRPNDICNAEQKAIFSLLTSIMIIAEKHCDSEK